MNAITTLYPEVLGTMKTWGFILTGLTPGTLTQPPRAVFIFMMKAGCGDTVRKDRIAIIP